MNATLRVEAVHNAATTRDREVEAGRLVLRAAAAADPFLTRRAAVAVAAAPSGPARRGLARAAEGLEAADAAAVKGGLLAFGAVLERHGLHPVALEVYRFLLGEGHGEGEADPCVALHAGRAARRSGHREEASRLYGLAAVSAAGDRSLELLARIGAALVSEDPAAQLNEAIRAARRQESTEAVAIGLEERAWVKRAAGRVTAAVGDLMAAARRYEDRQDRVRVLHALSDLLSARGDLLAAREPLLLALDLSDAATRGHTVQRLRTVARALGDEVGLRRTRGQGTASLTMLVPPRARAVPPSRSLTPRLRRWRSLMCYGTPG